MRKPLTILAVLLTAAVAHAQMPALPSFRADTVSILECGAVPDGVTLNTAAINGAINTLPGVFDAQSQENAGKQDSG